jgi:hypothetical protein
MAADPCYCHTFYGSDFVHSSQLSRLKSHTVVSVTWKLDNKNNLQNLRLLFLLQFNLPSSMRAHISRPEHVLWSMTKAAVDRVCSVVPGSAFCIVLRARSLTATISWVPALRSLCPRQTACKRKRRQLATLSAVIKSGDAAIHTKKENKKDILVSNKFTLGSQFSLWL